MAILIDRTDRIIVQGITGNVGGNFARRLLQHGTPVVGGVTPGKGGQSVAGVPVYDSVYQAREELGDALTKRVGQGKREPGRVTSQPAN